MWTEWSPATSTECVGIEFTQSRNDGCSPPLFEYRIAVGTATEVWSDWSPLAEDVCLGETVEQYRINFCNNDTEFRSVTGTNPDLC